MTRTRPTIVALALFLLSACPELESGPTAACAKEGDKCKTPEGPLGVCSGVTCPSGTPPPCLKCTGQH